MAALVCITCRQEKDSVEFYKSSKTKRGFDACGRIVTARSGAKRRLLEKEVPSASVDEILELKKKSSLCYLCGEKMVSASYHPRKKTLEHRIPLIKEGTNELDNLAFACYTCNCKKQAMTEEEYRAHLKKSKDTI